MKRSLACVWLLVGFVLAGAALAAEPDFLKPACGAASASPTVEASLGIPSPISLVPRCGDCSDSQCAGAFRGNFCTGPWNGGGGYSCQIVYGNTCSNGNFECFCWKGPLP